MMLYLIEDIKNQKAGLKRSVILCTFFLALLVAIDFAIHSTLHYGLERYFGLDHPAHTLLIGHSHTVLGIDPLLLEDRLSVSVAKYARQGATVSDRLTMIRQFMNRQPSSVRIIVYDVDAHLLNQSGLSLNSHRLFYPFLGDVSVSNYLRSETPHRSDYYLRKLVRSSRYGEVTLALAIRGLSGNWANYKSGSIDMRLLAARISEQQYRPIRLDPEQQTLLELTIAEVRRRNIHIVLAYYPTIDIYNQVDPPRYEESIRLFESLGAADPGVTFLNFNTELASRHEFFYDAEHMNPAGQRELTLRLADELQSLIERR